MNINEVTEKISGNADTAAIQETLNILPGKCSEGEHMDYMRNEAVMRRMKMFQKK